jgi:hypothetical protein
METISIEEAYKNSIERESIKLEKMNNIDEQSYGRLFGLKGINLTFFLHSLFREDDVQKSKNYLYKIGMVYAYQHEILKMEVFSVLNTFTFPILSDSSKLIERYLRYSETEYYDAFNTHYAKGIQSVLRDDMSALEKHIDGLRRRSKRGYAKQFTGIVTSYDGFLNNDSEQIIKGIYEILKNTKRQYPGDLHYQYINFEAAAIAKLAWRKGMEIEIDSALVPKELLPVKELEHYEGYDFFEGLRG